MMQIGEMGMSETRVRDKQIKVYVTEREREKLKRRARKAGVSVGELVRGTLIHSGDSYIRVIDIKPLYKASYRLLKCGTNLNQLMKFLNTYGPDAFDAVRVEQALKEFLETAASMRAALVSLRKEAEKHKVVICIEPPEEYRSYDDGNDG